MKFAENYILKFLTVNTKIHSHSICRGPSYGCRGKVLLPFEENSSSKIGVQFDKPIPEGNDLGGICEEGHGFFCNGDARKPD